MTYATQDDIQFAAGGSAALIQLTDQSNVGSLDANVLAIAQAFAESWMHGFLRERFKVPVIPTSTEGADTLRRLSAQETVYQLIIARRLPGDVDTKAREAREAELKAFADGERRPDEPLPTQSTAVVAAYVDSGLRRKWRDLP